MFNIKDGLYKKLKFFVNPIVFLSILVMVINDHFLKATFHNDLTGKLSDIFGLFFFPLFLSAGLIITGHFFGRNITLNRKIILWTIALGTLMFTLVNIWVPFHIFYESALQAIGIPSESTMDPTDLYCIPVVVLTYLHAQRYFKKFQFT